MNYFQKRINFYIHINLGIEIFYVFLKRMKENSFSETRIRELVHLFVEEVFKSKKISNLLKEKELLSRKKLNSFFWSIFKTMGIIDTNSFTKLFEISFLVLKKNLMYLKRVEDLNLLTKNHFQGLFMNHQKNSTIDSVVDIYDEVRFKPIRVTFRCFSN